MAIVSQVRDYNVAAYHEVKLQGNGILYMYTWKFSRHENFTAQEEQDFCDYIFADYLFWLALATKTITYFKCGTNCSALKMHKLNCM